MKIIFVLSHVNKSFQWLWVSEELKKRNISHYFIIINYDSSALTDDLKKINVPVVFLKHKNFFSFIINFFKTIRIYKSYRPDIVHTSLPFGNLIGLLSAWCLNIKCRITTCENASWAHDFNNKNQKRIDNLAFKLSKKVIATCESEKDYLAHNWKIKPGKLVTITQALKPELFQSVTRDQTNQLRNQLNVEKTDFLIGMIARFEYWKGHIYAVEAIRQLHSKYPAIKLLIFGSKGPDYESIMNKIKEYNLEEVILYKGFIMDIPALFKLIDIHIHIPINKYVETFGLSVIEGMISGCPQILTKSGIAYTTAINMNNSIVVDYCNVSEIVTAIDLLYNDPALRKQLATKAQTDATEQFNIHKKITKLIELYNSLLIK